MNTDAQLGKYRTAAESAAYGDGILEIVLSALFLIVALVSGRPALAWMYLLPILLLGPGLERLKARFTYPRIGYVRLPAEPPRRLRRGLVTWIFGVFLLVAVALFIAGHLTNNLAWRRASPVLAGTLFAGGFLYLAQRSRFWRHYVLAVASIGTGALMAWPIELEPYGNLRLWALLMAFLSMAMGVWVLRRFLRENPLAGERTPDA